MTIITTDILHGIAPQANSLIITDLSIYLDPNLVKYQVNNHLRVSHFLGQAAEETDGFKTLEEYASGASYEGRADLGNTQPGDGRRYKGRGIFQLTGRANYRQMGAKLGVDLENNPTLAADPKISVLTALEYWNTKGLSVFADHDDVNTITRRINGGTNGLVDRINYTNKAKRFVPNDPVQWNTPVITTPPQGTAQEIIYASEGNISEYVRQIQARLNNKTNSNLVTDGNFGPKTKSAVEAFQTVNHLTVNGVIDTPTLDKLTS